MNLRRAVLAVVAVFLVMGPAPSAQADYDTRSHCHINIHSSKVFTTYLQYRILAGTIYVYGPNYYSTQPITSYSNPIFGTTQSHKFVNTPDGSYRVRIVYPGYPEHNYYMSLHYPAKSFTVDDWSP